MNYRETTLFFPKGPRKKERDPSKFDYYYYTFSATVTPRSKRVSPFRLSLVSFFPFVSLFRLLTIFASKKQHPLSESRERERALLPSWCISPNNKKSSQNTTTASEDVIYIYILTHTRVTQNTSQYSTTHDERRRQDEIFKVLRAVERRTRAR